VTKRRWLIFWGGFVALWFAPVFPYRLPCADPPYHPGFLAEVRESWDREGFLYIMADGYPLMNWLHALGAYLDPKTAKPEQYATKIAIVQVERHAAGATSSYIRAAPEDVRRLLELYREIGTERQCEPTIIGLKGDLPPETWVELRADPDWPE
jgi:hypothetical protein